MIRKIIRIDEDKCNGCGLCATACHEGAIEMIEGKAKLVRENFCDGLGDCLPACPTGAITFEEREAEAYDEAAVKASQEKARMNRAIEELRAGGGCPGSRIRQMKRDEKVEVKGVEASSQLCNWPVQIKLAPVNGPYFDGAKLLIAADCSAFAYGNFHGEFLKGKVALIGCPKLDMVDYSQKLTEIIRENNIKSVTVVRMEVPCCGGIENAVMMAIKNSGKFLPWQVVTISTDGEIVD